MIAFELAQVYGLNYALVAEWAGYVDARLPVDADLLNFVVRTFVSLDAGEQEPRIAKPATESFSSPLSRKPPQNDLSRGEA